MDREYTPDQVALLNDLRPVIETHVTQNRLKPEDGAAVIADIYHSLTESAQAAKAEKEGR